MTDAQIVSLALMTFTLAVVVATLCLTLPARRGTRAFGVVLASLALLWTALGVTGRLASETSAPDAPPLYPCLPEESDR